MNNQELINKINALYGSINSNPPAEINYVRKQIINVFRDVLDVLGKKNQGLDMWEKDHLALAISAFLWDLNIMPSDSWLDICLTYIEKSLTPMDKRSQSYSLSAERIRRVEKLTTEDFQRFICQLEDIAN